MSARRAEMEKKFINLSQREIERLRIIHKVMDRQMTQMKASELLGITDRQERNIIRKIRQKGDRAIAHRNRGRVSYRRMVNSIEGWIGIMVGAGVSGY